MRKNDKLYHCTHVGFHKYRVDLYENGKLTMSNTFYLPELDEYISDLEKFGWKQGYTPAEVDKARDEYIKRAAYIITDIENV